MAALFDRNPRAVTWDELDGFLKEGHLESERLEYKIELQSSVADTLVAFANMEGGLLIGGVIEEHGKPKSWPGIDGKDPLGTLANHNSMQCLPPVRYEQQMITNPATGKPLLLVRVERSLRRPHMTRQKGILVRVGDQERPADLELTRKWFLDSERQQLDADKRFARPLIVPPSLGVNVAGAVCIVTHARPLTEIVPLQLTEAIDNTIGDLLTKDLHGGWVLVSRRRTTVEFYNQVRRIFAHIESDGFTEVTGHWPQPAPGTNPSVDLIDFVSMLHRQLCFQLKLLREVFVYSDDVRVRIQVLNVNSAQFVSPAAGHHLEFLGQVPASVEYDLTLTSEAEVAGQARSALLAIFRDAQVEGYGTEVGYLLRTAHSRGWLPVCT